MKHLFDTPRGRGTVGATMSRKLAILLLALSMISAGLATCPRGAVACALLQQANHQCCGNHLSLRTRDCCRGERLPTPAFTSGAAGNGATHLAKLLVTSASCLLTPAQPARGFPPSDHQYGLAPPDTLVTRHTSLLL